jgi:hypothetical protein
VRRTRAPATVLLPRIRSGDPARPGARNLPDDGGSAGPVPPGGWRHEAGVYRRTRLRRTMLVAGFLTRWLIFSVILAAAAFVLRR